MTTGTLRPVSWRWARLLLGILLLPLAVFAHGELQVQIDNETAAIAQDPTNPRLYATRAELYRMHEQFDEALADLEIASGLDPELSMVDFIRGKVYVDLKHPKAARAAFDRYLTRTPTAVDGYLARAQLFTAQNQVALAIADYTQAIQRSKTPLPEYYIERARLDQKEGGGGAEAALKGLDEGIARLGAIVTLELPAIELEIAAQRFDAALARLDLLMAPAERKESWLELRGTILQRAAKYPEALATYQQALAELAKASERSQATPMMKALKARLEQRIASFKDSTGGAPEATPVTPERRLP